MRRENVCLAHLSICCSKWQLSAVHALNTQTSMHNHPLTQQLRRHLASPLLVTYGLCPSIEIATMKTTPEPNISGFCGHNAVCHGTTRHPRACALCLPRQAVAKPQVENMINGFNGCCFAYGQTGSGENAGDSKHSKYVV